jgi:ribosomal protein S12 methylthiotransferase
MVGHPGESEEDFEELMQFVRDARFERMGAFAYCEEEGTYAARHYADDIADDIKQQRLDRLMALQEEVAAEINAAKQGTIQRVLVDREEDDYYVARTQYDSPEVDNEVLIEKSRKLTPGTFCDVEIIEAMPFDLIARPC